MSKRKQIRMEFEVKASPALVYSSISTPSGLSSWFCHDVDIRNNIYKFKWDGEEISAELVKKLNNKLIKFHWLNSQKDEFFELEITQDELTGDVALVVTDFVDESEENNTRQLWDSQIHDLRSSLGA